MRKHLWQNDGRLKTGRISLIFFLCLLLGLGLLFNLQKPVDKALVVVKHIFIAKPESRSAAPAAKPEKPAVKPQAKVVKNEKKVLKPEETTPQPKPVPVKTVEAEPVKNKVSPPAAPDKAQTARKTQTAQKLQAEPKVQTVRKARTEPKAQKTVRQEPTEKPAVTAAAETENRKIAKSRELTPAAAEKKSPAAPAAAVKPAAREVKTVAKVNPRLPKEPAAEKPALTPSPADILPEELVVAPPLLQAPDLPAASPANPPAVTLLTKAQLRVLQTGPAPAAKAVKKSVKTVKFAPIKPLKVRKTSATAAVKPVIIAKNSSKFKAVSTKIKAKPEPVKVGATSGITVAKKEYKKLHHAWRAAGHSEKDDDHIIPLQIENLRAAYDLLQMKAVVIRADDSCIDLADGSRIPQAALDRFSTTVLQVKDPWQKWGPQLKAAGLRPGQKFQVRYYLYDFVSRSIYARVNQAYRWSLAQGLIQAETRPDEVDVLGRTFVIKRAGGGAFGVFVPLSLETGTGRKVAIDPVCFGNAPDINALRSAGLI